MVSKTNQVANGNGSFQSDFGEQVDKANQDKVDHGREPVFDHIQLATAFARQYRKEFCFNHDIGKWFYFTGYRWVKSTGEHEIKLQDFIASKFEHSKKNPTGHDYRQVEKLARPRMKKLQSEFDANPFAFGTPNFHCFFSDCEKGNNPGFVEGKPKAKHLITMNTAVDRSDEESPKWLEFLKTAIPDEETREWLRLVFGQALIGMQTEHIFIYIYGPAGTGKTLFVERIKNAFGDYAGIFPREYLIKTYGERHTTGLTDLLNKRVVFADEVEGNKWDQSLIKLITGGGTIKARRMCQNNFEFQQSHTLVGVGNDLPGVKFETAMEQRLRLVHFNVFPAGKVNQRLAEELDAEAGGILQHYINGGVDYLAHHYGKNPNERNSLYTPDKVKKDTEAYLKADAYLFRELVGDDCVFGYGGEILKSEALKLASKAVPRINWTATKLSDLLLDFGGITWKHRRDGDYFQGLSKNPKFYH